MFVSFDVNKLNILVNTKTLTEFRERPCSFPTITHTHTYAHATKHILYTGTRIVVSSVSTFKNLLHSLYNTLIL